ncbi:hypothetical protein BH23ACT2_BH23ACT2_15890 [soil metagenome]
MHAVPFARSDQHQDGFAPADGPFPWEEAHAAPEDRAVGLELELIELVRRRDDIGDASDPEVVQIDREIDAVVAELGRVTPSLPLAG